MTDQGSFYHGVFKNLCKTESAPKVPKRSHQKAPEPLQLFDSLPDLPYQPDRVAILEQQVAALEKTVYNLSALLAALAEKTSTPSSNLNAKSDELIQTAYKFISQ